ncbi:DnaJ domain-containing protein [Nostoc linckia]|uniref:DnaJ domain-containing protein n=1 Tax=Nostoc linckia TaxID=92942 RepID=UPI000BFF9980|nr:DnaJ domain-containing protein [Nostoc linckia]
MDNLEQCYQVLGVSSDASVDEIKQAYKDLVQVWHPDRYAHNPRLQRKTEAELKAINSAYEIIMESLASGHNVRKTTNVYKKESSSTQVSEPEPVVEVKTNLQSKVKSWINKNKWILITGTGASILISLQIYAYTKYKDFPFSNPILLIQRISSSFFLERNILGDEELGYSSIKFSSNGAIFSSYYPSSYIKTWDFHNGKKLKSSDLNLWPIDTGQLINVKHLNCKISNSPVLTSYKISPDSKLLVNLLKSSDSDDFTIEVCDLTNGERVHTLDKIAKYLEVEFSPDSKILAIGNRNNWNKTIELYNLETGKIDQSFIDVTNDIALIQTLTFTPDGRFLLTGSNNGVRIWRIR